MTERERQGERQHKPCVTRVNQKKKKDFIYLFDRERHREGTQAGGVGEREAGFPLSREPNAGLDPRTLGY